LRLHGIRGLRHIITRASTLLPPFDIVPALTPFGIEEVVGGAP
jgi:hypothetical protein